MGWQGHSGTTDADWVMVVAMDRQRDRRVHEQPAPSILGLVVIPDLPPGDDLNYTARRPHDGRYGC